MNWLQIAAWTLAALYIVQLVTLHRPYPRAQYYSGGWLVFRASATLVVAILMVLIALELGR